MSERAVVDAASPLTVRFEAGDQAVPAECLASYTPVDGDRVRVDTSGPGLPVVLGSTGAHQATVVGRATAPVAFGSGGDTTLVTAPAVTGDGAKRLRITASLTAITGDASTAYTVKIKADGAQVRSSYVVFVTGQTASNFVTLTVTHVPAAGSHVYTLTAIQIAGGGSPTAVGSATDPIELVVEEV